MIELVIFLVIIILVSVGSLMIAGRVLGAANTGFFSCLMLAVFIGAIEKSAGVLIGNPGFAIVAAIAATGAIVSYVMQTSYAKGVAISLLTIGVMYVLVAAIAGLGIATGFAEIDAGT